MIIGIIGIGNIGGTLARKLRKAGHEVRVANSRGADGVKDFAAEINAIAADVRSAVEGADAIVLSIPLPAVSDLPGDLFDDVPATVAIIDTSNYYPGMRDPQIPELDDGKVESVWVSEQIGRPVIKAFNNILAYSLAELGRPEGADDRLAIAVAGDDPQPKSLVCDLVNDTGFDVVDGGTLAESWRQQPSTPSYCCEWNAEDMRKALTAAKPDEAPKTRNRLMDQFAALGSNPSHADIVASNRATNAPSLNT